RLPLGPPPPGCWGPDGAGRLPRASSGPGPPSRPFNGVHRCRGGPPGRTLPDAAHGRLPLWRRPARPRDLRGRRFSPPRHRGRRQRRPPRPGPRHRPPASSPLRIIAAARTQRAVASQRGRAMTRLTRMLVAVLGVLLAALAAIGLYLTQPALPPRGESPETPVVDAARLRAHVEEISGELSPRSFDRPDNLDRAADYIRAELQRSSARVMDQAFVFEGYSYRNVIASFGPAEGERIVVGAHYDAFGSFPGADDNASGVAALLELSRLLGGVAP